jgi:hypothetical protein
VDRLRDGEGASADDGGERETDPNRRVPRVRTDEKIGRNGPYINIYKFRYKFICFLVPRRSI